MAHKKTFQQLANTLRQSILTISHNAHVGHVGSAFSIVEMLVALYFGIMKKGDKFILSKGHAAPALYAILNAKGLLSDRDLKTYCIDGSVIEEHPNHVVPGVEVSTGSLGHGLSIGVGMALAAKIQKNSTKVFVLASDAECNEGETWEAALSAAHHGLDNLFVFLDYNQVQAFGKTQEVLGIEPVADKWRSFGWNVCDVDGHDIAAMIDVTTNNQKKALQPTIIICNTIRGKGVGFMEHVMDWHYKNPSQTEFAQAMKELRGM